MNKNNLHITTGVKVIAMPLISLKQQFTAISKIVIIAFAKKEGIIKQRITPIIFMMAIDLIFGYFVLMSLAFVQESNK